MIDRTTKLRWRRRVRRSRRQVEDIGFQAEEKLERHFFKRLAKLPNVLRFGGTWVLLMLILIGGTIVQTRYLGNYYLTNQPTPGGVYSEGILGSFTNANPLYASSSVDASVSHLVFSGLLKLDSNNKLVGDLAKSWTVDTSEQNYTVVLNHGLKWQDGQPLTAQDVVFTYNTIKNPDAKSPLFAAWQDITIKALNDTTIRFTLPNPLAPFPYGLTNGIVPRHLLKDIPAAQLRSSNFNTSKPVGSGPFKWSLLNVNGETPETREEQITLTPFNDYVGGKPRLGKFIIRSFHDENHLLASFRDQQLNGVVGLSSLPKDLANDLNIYEHHIPLLGEVLVFFKESNPILKDLNVRKALIMATDKGDVISNLGFPVALANEPILKGQLGYQKSLAELKYNPKAAAALLDKAGWKVGPDGTRSKKGTALSFTLTSQQNPEYDTVTAELQRQWRAVGVNIQILLLPAIDLQTKLTSHSYDALLYGIEMGADPDVFAYWHSSQADIRSQNRLNFSEYQSAAADAALESGRTRLNPRLRAIKYRPFLQAWRADVPAIALYQPQFLYVTRGQVFGFMPSAISKGYDRYANVNNWMIRESKQPI